MSPRTIIVTGCDSKQFPLARNLLSTVEADAARASIAMGFIDGGLAPADRAELTGRSIAVAPIAWDFDFPTRAIFEATAPGVATLFGKLRMRRLFPGYDVYVWLDADTAVLDWTAIPEIAAEALRGQLAIGLEFDRLYFRGHLDWKMWRHFDRWYEEAFGAEVAAAMSLKPMINTGVYGIAADAPLWDLWERLYVEAMRRQTDHRRGPLFMSEQSAMNVAIHHHRMAMTALPATCNWLCHLALPMWDPAAGRLVEPAPPYDPIRILHLSGWSKDKSHRILGRDGRTYRSRLFQPLDMQPEPPTQ
ncbi:hypothetical protein EDC65_4971 [Stella humosa]|uniref:Uncharacterized protein n=1 Tax=Stella humosa TaxID=94 RepID=A0A3N1KSM3_9PROT|nr:hypothetical protein [Stella humosa]ROP81116.1 hypothetical protein EDC65_4971 [Stella humosa]BBK32461.1 hypothetical protein STHU_30950 [Stella humosa]